MVSIVARVPPLIGRTVTEASGAVEAAFKGTFTARVPAVRLPFFGKFIPQYSFGATSTADVDSPVTSSV